MLNRFYLTATLGDKFLQNGMIFFKYRTTNILGSDKELLPVFIKQT